MKSLKVSLFVTPAKAGVQNQLNSVDSGFRRNDGEKALFDFLRDHQFLTHKKSLYANSNVLGDHPFRAADDYGLRRTLRKSKW